MIEEIRLHGLGGQGVVACSELIAIAASYEGKFCRAFPMYSSARRGAPVQAFAQIGPESEATRSMVYHPKYLLVLDIGLLRLDDTLKGFRNDGVVIVNTTKSLNEVNDTYNLERYNLGILDALGIANKIIGHPIPNTPILGAFSRMTSLLKLESIWKAIEKRFSGSVSDANKKASQIGYEEVSFFE